MLVCLWLQVILFERFAIGGELSVVAFLDVIGGELPVEVEPQHMDVAERARRHQPHARPRGALAI